MFWKKNKKNEFACIECGEIHSEWPALAYSSPTNFHNLSEKEQEEIAELTTDFCIIEYEDQTDRFIRVSLNQKITDSKEELQYGLWVTLSEKSFKDYEKNYNNENHEVEYFGWLSSYLPDYHSTISIPTTVVTQPGNQRPIIYPHKDHDHQFVRDFNNGISSHEAQRRVDAMLNNVG